MKLKTKDLTVVAVLAAISVILQYLEFPIPALIPSFVKFDFSDIPALIGAFLSGPLCGVLICLLKNLIHLAVSQSGGVGELANFLLGTAFVVPAGIIYKKNKNRKTALTGCIIGSVLMGILSFPINYFITYPFYSNFMPIDAIIAAYNEIFKISGGLISCLLVFNLPFTITKGLISSVLTFVIYKKISRFIKSF